MVYDPNKYEVLKYLAPYVRYMSALKVVPALISKHALLIWKPPTSARMNGYCYNIF